MRSILSAEDPGHPPNDENGTTGKMRNDAFDRWSSTALAVVIVVVMGLSLLKTHPLLADVSRVCFVGLFPLGMFDLFWSRQREGVPDRQRRTLLAGTILMQCIAVLVFCIGGVRNQKLLEGLMVGPFIGELLLGKLVVKKASGWIARM